MSHAVTDTLHVKKYIDVDIISSNKAALEHYTVSFLKQKMWSTMLHCFYHRSPALLGLVHIRAMQEGRANLVFPWAAHPCSPWLFNGGEWAIAQLATPKKGAAPATRLLSHGPIGKLVFGAENHAVKRCCEHCVLHWEHSFCAFPSSKTRVLQWFSNTPHSLLCL